MKTFGTVLELCEFAFANLQLKLGSNFNPEKIKRSLLDAILREEKKNKNHKLAIAKLIYLLRFITIDEQILKIYHILAARLSQCKDADLEFLDFIIYQGPSEFMNRPRMKVIIAMCSVAKYKVASVPEVELQSAYRDFALLKELGLSFYFEPPVFSLDNKRRKAEETKRSA